MRALIVSGNQFEDSELLVPWYRLLEERVETDIVGENVSKAIKRVHAVVHGKVQGVFFRETTCQQGRKLGLSGWVRNLTDGTVETEFQGEEEAVRRMLEWLPQGSSLSRVARVESRKMDPVSGESDFMVTWL